MVTLEARRAEEAAASSQRVMLALRAASSSRRRASRSRSERAARALPGALRDPRAVAQVRRRSVRRRERPVVLDPDAVRAPDHQEPDPHLLPAGAHEGAWRRACDFEARHVHVVGAGVMGGDIAAICAMRGLTRHAAGHRARAHRAGGEARRRALQAPAARPAPRARRARPPDPGRRAATGARQADVIIEAIFENLEAKRAAFREARGALPSPDAILATNTSSLKLADIATALQGPVAPGRHPFLQPGAAAAAGRSRLAERRPTRSSRKRPPPSCARSTSCRCR